jgi:copper oxidase (laccase) domain-containing protein
MKTRYGTNPADVIMISSPSISAESYVFDSTDGMDLSFWGQDVSKGKDGKYHMDIKSRFESQAINAGIKRSNMTISPTDTFTDINYFSHRRSMATGEPEGRFAVFAQIRPLSA